MVKCRSSKSKLRVRFLPLSILITKSLLGGMVDTLDLKFNSFWSSGSSPLVGSLDGGMVDTLVLGTSC